MPGRNVRKEFVDGGIYHVYNRGVEKRDIFTDIPDYKTFLYFLKQYLLEGDDPKKEFTNFKGRKSVRRSFVGRIELLAYCLMPNHYHLLIKQTNENDLSEFMKCLATSYSLYFNDRHDRVGALFQGTYRAVLVKDDSQLLQLSSYIHRNPLGGADHFDKGPTFVSLEGYDYSSYQDYIGLRNTKWVKTDLILGLLGEEGTQSAMNTAYSEFVNNQASDASNTEIERLKIE